MWETIIYVEYFIQAKDFDNHQTTARCCWGKWVLGSAGNLLMTGNDAGNECRCKDDSLLNTGRC